MAGIILTQLLATWKRTIAIVIAVVIGVSFLTASLLSGNLVNVQMGNQIGNSVRGADLVITSSGPDLTAEQVAAIDAVDGVDRADRMLVAAGSLEVGSYSSYFVLGRISELPDIREGIQLTEGRLPQARGEIILTDSTNQFSNVKIGDDIVWEPYVDEEGVSGQFTVVGIFRGGPNLALNAADGLVLEDDFSATAPEVSTPAILVQTEDDANVASVKAEAQSVLSEGIRVETFDAFVDRAVDVYTSGALQVQILTGVFALVAMFAAGIVISNTLQITVAQRIRELAIMRCVGAKADQVKRSVLVEAMLIGLVSSAIGVLVGFGLVALVNVIAFEADNRADSLGITAVSVLVPILVGTIVTTVAALKPAQSATRVHPLQAIRHAEAPVETERMGRIRVIGSVVVNLAGICLLLLGWGITSRIGMESGLGLLVGVMGGMVSFLGILIATRLVIPPILTILGGAAARISGVTGDLATTNLQRNPGRTSSTSAALLMGVTLVTMCVVGVATMKSTFVDFFDERAAIDLDFRVVPDGDDLVAMNSNVRASIANVDGVENVAPVVSSRVTVVWDDGSWTELDGVGIDPEEASSVSRAEGVGSLADNVMIVSDFDASFYGFTEGQVLTLEGPGGQHDVTVVVENVFGDEVILSANTMEAISGVSDPVGVWVRMEEGANVGDVTQGVQNAVPPEISLAVDGNAHEREVNLRLMDQILLVAMGLLAAAVVIAVIGVGNTLTLSVIERTRESGMLRAMGLTATQLRHTLAIEGVLLALVGAVIGMVAGTLYGWIGALTLFGDSFPVSIGFPVVQMGLILVAAIVCGWLASVLPARNAMTISPVQALSVAE